MSEANKTKNIYQRIQAVGMEIKNIEKNLTVGTGGFSYKAVGDLDVVLAVKQAEEKHGLVSIPVRQELIRTDIVKVQDSKGGERINYVDVVKMTVRIVNVDNVDEHIEVEALGRGLDPSDKGFGKASTYARKYALLNAYKIATGEDPDAEKSKETTPISEDELRNKVMDFLAKNGDYRKHVFTHFNVEHLDDLTNEQVAKLAANIRKKGIEL